MKKITVWIKVEEIKDKEGNITGESKSFNHISDEWSELSYPTPAKEEFTNQKAWEHMTWEKRFAYLNQNYKVIYA